MRRCGGYVGITSTPKHFEVVVGGLGGIKGAIWCGEGEGFSGEAIHKICHGVKGLNPIGRRETRLKQKGT